MPKMVICPIYRPFGWEMAVPSGQTLAASIHDRLTALLLAVKVDNFARTSSGKNVLGLPSPPYIRFSSGSRGISTRVWMSASTGCRNHRRAVSNSTTGIKEPPLHADASRATTFRQTLPPIAFDRIPRVFLLGLSPPLRCDSQGKVWTGCRWRWLLTFCRGLQFRADPDRAYVSAW